MTLKSKKTKKGHQMSRNPGIHGPKITKGHIVVKTTFIFSQFVNRDE